MFLTSSGLYNFSIGCEDFFTFEVGTKKYEVPIPSAIFFSNKIANIIFNEKTSNRYSVSTKDPNGDFRVFADAMFGKEINLPFDNQKSIITLCLIAHELENQELVELILNNTHSDIIDIVTKLTISPDDKTIALACQKFQELPLEKIPIEILKILFDRSDIAIPNENWLFRKVLSLIEIDNAYKELLDYIDISFLSKEDVVEYCSYVDHSQITNHKWQLIKKRLTLDVKPWCIRGLSLNDSKFIGMQKDPFKGVFYYIRTEYGNKLADAVTVTCTNEESDNRLSLSDLIIYDEYRSNGYFRTTNSIQNPYIQIKFNHHYLQITGYSIKSNSSGYAFRFMKSWQLSASNNEEEEFKEIDLQTNDELVGTDKVFTTQVDCDKKYSIFRITMMGFNSNHDYRLCLQEIEFFGYLFNQNLYK